MKFAIMGSGGVGGYFGARLAEAGEDVTFIARGDHLAAIRDSGLRILSDAGDVTIHPTAATDDPEGVGPVDYVLFAVKLYDTETAGRLAAPLVANGGAVVDLQNGIDSGDQLAGILGREAVIGGVAYISSHIESPGVIRHTGLGAKLVLGELDGLLSPRVEALEKVCNAAGLDAAATDDIALALWSKFALLAPMSAMSCLSRLPIEALTAVPETDELMAAAIDEVTSVAAAAGVQVPTEIFKSYKSATRGAQTSIKPSMLVDLERGKPLEIDYLSGALARRGQALGVPTPLHAMAATILKPHAAGAAANEAASQK